MPVSSYVGRPVVEGSINSSSGALRKFGVCMKEDRIMKSVCLMLERLAGEVPVSYSAKIQCGVDLFEFANKIYRAGLCAKECFVIALIYIQRMLKKKCSIQSPYHRVFLISVLLASKFLDDFYCRNVYFASVGECAVAELNKLELTFCFQLDFDLHVSQDQFDTSMFALSMESCFAPSPTSFHIPSPPSKPLKNDARKSTPVKSAWPVRHDAHAAPAVVFEFPIDPTGIWNPLPRSIPACIPRALPVDPLGAASAWHSRPYCSTA